MFSKQPKQPGPNTPSREPPEPTLEFKPSLKTYPKMRPLCKHCGDTFSAARRKAGYSLCLLCGEEQSIQDRKQWCVSLPYSKGAYQLITNIADLTNTNPKQTRGEVK